MSRLLIPFLLILVLANACTSEVTTPEQVIQPGEQGAKPVVTVYRPPT